MEFFERSFAGEFFRPKPKIILSENPTTLLVITPWGEKDESDYILQLFSDQLKMDTAAESTTPFAQIESLGVRGNQLRTAAMLANDYLLKSANRTEYIAAAEFLGIIFENGILSWVQIGSPHLLIQQKNRLQPLAFNLDHSWQRRQTTPLLTQALGFEAHCQLNCGSLYLAEDSELFMVSRDHLANEILGNAPLNLPSMTQLMVKDSGTSPFWAGHLKL